MWYLLRAYTENLLIYILCKQIREKKYLVCLLFWMQDTQCLAANIEGIFGDTLAACNTDGAGAGDTAKCWWYNSQVLVIQLSAGDTAKCRWYS